MIRLLCILFFITTGAHVQNSSDSALDQSRRCGVLNYVVHNTADNKYFQCHSYIRTRIANFAGQIRLGTGSRRSEPGNDDDLYVNYSTGDLYGPRSSRSWDSALTPVAPDGRGPTGATEPQRPTLAYPTYTSGASYSVNTYVTGSDMNIYRSLASTTGNDPITDRGRNWELATVNVNTTLNVPSRFTTFGEAWTFLQNAMIGQGRLVTIKFVDGTYNFGTTRFVINHPQGSQISIIGDTTTPTKVILNFTGPSVAFRGYIQANWAFWAINAGHNIGLIDGFTINGPGMAASNAYGAVAISAFGASSVTVGPHVAINNAYSGVAAFFNSTIWADGITVTGGGDGNIWAYAGSTISCNACTS